MDPATYTTLTHPREIRIFVLQPGTGQDDLVGHLKHIRLPNEPPTVPAENHWSSSGLSGQSWAWSFSENETYPKPKSFVLPSGKTKVVFPKYNAWSYRCSREKYGAKQYDALSYTWGDPAKANAINMQGYRFPITANLAAGLYSLRSPHEERRLWIDAICINQQDIKERNHQVRLMKQVFSHASSVVVWLGNTNSSAIVSNLILDYNYYLGYGVEMNILTYPASALASLRTLFSLPWWKRIWIVQEAVAARELLVLHGNRALPWDFLKNICNALQRNEFRSDANALIVRTCGYQKFKTLDNFRTHKSMLLTRLLQCTRDYGATDPRDKLYALLGMASDVSADDLVPDYARSVESVFTNLVQFMVSQKGSLDIISSGRLALAGPGLPTWIPDWRVSDSLRPLSGEEVAGHRYHASGDSMAAVDMRLFPSVLAAEGVIADKIDFLGGTLILAHESPSTLRRWKYIAEQNLPADTLGLFPRTIIAEKDNLGNMASEEFIAASEAFMEGSAEDMGQARVQFYADAVTRAVTGRRFFLTKKGRMGLGPGDAQLNDKIVVLKGCSVPLIMRAVEGGGAVLIGEAYVSGIMNGQVMADVARGKGKMTKIMLR
ncbi:heterokaryon incompatibility protein-domain-containing protein [Podospora didyma]|uniref:Heterokaryon incompatibility protein-domain-containing protein n=1 Tax=Podospora didyma TaxID=330526 RepID=A0AAE0NHZ9_9PEZI|nr:heterokaryon incompatibility protein-domain-containing protein [Podospora didyma]